jgi:hypothetical protein
LRRPNQKIAGKLFGKIHWGVNAIIVLYDLQEEIKAMSVGIFPEEYAHLASCGDLESGSMPVLNLVEEDGVKSVMVSKRVLDWDGVSLKMPTFGKVWPGDRITVTGRIASNVPKGSWAMGLFVQKNATADQIGLEQHLLPNPEELFTVSYILDAADLEYNLIIRTSSWGDEGSGRDGADLDFFIDSILITRSPESANVVPDPRTTIYAMESDASVQDLPLESRYVDGRVLRRAGEPQVAIREFQGKRCLHVFNRINDWDGIDIRMAQLELLRGNHYTIHVRGRIDGKISEGTQIMLQFLPGYTWRDNQFVTDNQEFTLNHTLSAMEVSNGETIRIATNGPGTDVSFYIYDINIIGKPLVL